MELTLLQKTLRAVASAMETPVVIILLIFIALSVFFFGWMLVELFTERRHINRSLPQLMEDLRTSDDLKATIQGSQLLLRQKAALLELISHPDFSDTALSALAENLLEKEHAHYDTRLKLTSLVSRLAPMAGLLGTLIPLGPGIIALGNGDTYTLSVSMLTAFDTTVAGLASAGICLVVHTVHSRWYSTYMSDLEALFDCVVDLVTAR